MEEERNNQQALSMGQNEAQMEHAKNAALNQLPSVSPAGRRSAAADPLVFRSATYSVGSFPQNIAVGDFTGDGKLDIVASNASDNTVSVLLNNGDGTFQPQHTYQVGSFPTGLAVGDFNNDGNLDIAVTNQDGTVSVLLGNGDGTFQPQQTYPAGVSISIAVGDFNNDGKLDIVTPDVEHGAVSILLGNGDGTFQPQQTYLARNDPLGLAVGDFNNDGNLDIAVTNQESASVTVLLQQPPLAVKVNTIQAIQDVPFSGPIATISGAHMASDTTATINWGDGSASNGTVSGSGNTLTVSGSHTYTQGGPFTLIVTASEGTFTAQGVGQALVKTANLHARAFGVQSLKSSQSPFGDVSIPPTGGNQTVTNSQQSQLASQANRTKK